MKELVGLLPAAGRGSRLGAIPCSKEIMPLGFQLDAFAEDKQWRPITAIETHLHALKLAGVERVVIIVSESKHDIVRYIGNGERYGLSVAYLYQQQLSGMPFALDLAAAWLHNATTLFSMPDTLVEPVNISTRLVQHHQQSQADVTLGLFETTTPHKFGMVRFDQDGNAVAFVDKPRQTDLSYMWGLAVWSPAFRQFMSRFLVQRRTATSEVVLSDVFQAALDYGLRIQTLVLEHAHYHDIGTPEDFQAVVYQLAVRRSTALK